MKPSRFNVLWRQGDRIHLFHSRRLRTALLDSAMASALQENHLERLSPAQLIALVKLGAIVPDHTDEWAEASRELEATRSHGDLRLVVIPTYRCNLRCSYCYGGDAMRKTKARAAANWADEIGAFLARRVPTLRLKHVTLGLFGGEPLLEAGRCPEVVTRAQEVAAAHGAQLYTTLTTNGTILNRMVRELLPAINSLQLTFDGVAEDHDLWRVYPGGGGTYRRIVDFVQAAASASSQVAIRYHLHPAARQSLRDSAARLLADIGGARGVYLYCAQVLPGCYLETFKCSHEEEGSSQLAEEELFRARSAFLDAGWPEENVYVRLRGNERYPICRTCGFIGEENLMIDPYLDVYFCPVALRNPDLLLGRLRNGEGEFTRLRSRLLNGFGKEGACRECDVFPLCAGGCPVQALVNHEDALIPFCKCDRIHEAIRLKVEEGMTA